MFCDGQFLFREYNLIDYILTGEVLLADKLAIDRKVESILINHDIVLFFIAHAQIEKLIARH